MKIIFFGTPDFVIPVLASLLKHHNVIAVVTAPDHFDKKKNKTVPSPVKDYYQHYYKTHSDSNERHPLQIYTPEKLSTIHSELATLQPDLFVVSAYGKIIPQSILDIPSLGALNVHPSLLPKYRGPSPITFAILNGDTTTGVCIIKMDAKMDHGPILASTSEPIFDTDTFVTLAQRLFEKSAELLPDVIQNYAAGRIPLNPQDETQVTFTRIIIKDDGYIDLERLKHAKSDIHRITRAYFPWPGAWTKVTSHNREFRIKFLPAVAVQNRNVEQDIQSMPATNLYIQPEGKKPMSVKNFLNGYPDLKETLSFLNEISTEVTQTQK